MEFDIDLVAKTSDEGGITASFDAQLAELGGTATIVTQVNPYRVDLGGGKFYFEAKRTYHIVY